MGDSTTSVPGVTLTTNSGGTEIGRMTAALQGTPGLSVSFNPAEPAIVPKAIPLAGIKIEPPWV